MVPDPEMLDKGHCPDTTSLHAFLYRCDRTAGRAFDLYW